MTNGIEIEVRAKVENSRPLVEFLGNNATFVSEQTQVDQYFTPANKDFTSERPVREWLRLRAEDGRYSVNYKNWHFDGSGKAVHCDEFETAVEDIDQIRLLFAALGMRTTVNIIKTRKIWMYGEYEVAIDNVQGLGDFVEVEFKGDPYGKEPTDIARKMIEFLKSVGIDRLQFNYQGYPFMMLFPEETKYFDD
jgi:adenylate cyclase, class 2